MFIDSHERYFINLNLDLLKLTTEMDKQKRFLCNFEIKIRIRFLLQ